MDFEDIVNDLTKRFKKDYPEFYNRRIVVWYDQEKDFEDSIDNIDIENVKILKMNENNKFQIKKTLCADDTESDYLVYCPIYFENPEDNWITDIFMYSEEFRADRVSIEIAEMELEDKVSIRRKVKEYNKFFNAKKRREEIRKVSKKIDSPRKLVLAIMSIIAKSEMRPDDIIRNVIKAGAVNENNEIYQEFVNYGLDGTFWDLCSHVSGYSEEEKSIGKLFVTLLITAVSRNINRDVFIGLEQYIKTTHETFCFQFIEDWLRDSRDKEIFKAMAKDVEIDISLYQRLLKEDIVKYDSSEFFPAVDEAILAKVMEDIKNDIIDPENLLKIVDNRRVKAWYEDYEDYYEGIYYMARMKEFYNKNQASFHETNVKKLWDAYASDYYRMDTYYRKFQRAFQRSLTDSIARLDDEFKAVVERGEGIYKHWFLDNLLSNWCNTSGESLEKYGFIPEVAQQINFYKDNIRETKNKVFVIISDAMRYEVGVELADVLQREMQCKIEKKNMEGIFPTITPFGMAALLPNKNISTEVNNGNLYVLNDGQYTSSNYREKILKKYNENSVILKYDELIQMKRDERKEKVKGMEVVYIYHNRIDEAGHGNGYEVFSACEKAIDEIKNLVRIIVNEFSGVNIMITSDHGFIYTYEAFTEDDKVEKSGFEGVVSNGKRYAIMDENAEPDYMMPVKFVDENAGLKGFTPRENIRIKKPGGGINFVHGGVSLQEMMVPLILYRHLRNDSREYQKDKNKFDVKPVEIKLISNFNKVSNMIFDLQFYQTEMISSTREASVFTLYFIDEDGRKVSDEVRIIADKGIDSDERDRKFNVRFNLKAGKYGSKKSYYLMIIEESGKLVPEKIEFTIDIPFSTGDYDFFN